jgi:hypothetical protein
MSTYEVSAAHIRYLVDLGRELAIGSIMVDGQPRPVDLADPGDRQVVAASLFGANRNGTWSPDSPEIARLVDTRQSPTGPSVRALEDLVQALQWVRSYCYQACRSPKWSMSAACSFTDQLRDSIETRIIRLFATQWDFPSNA